MSSTSHSKMRYGSLIFVLFFCVGEGARLPADIGRCRLDDPYINDCLAKNVEIAIRKFRDGAPKLGIPKFEPLSIPKLVIGQGSGPVNLQQNLEDIHLYGLTGSKITNYTAKLDRDKIYTESLTPRLELLADYHMDGRILILPVRGRGKCNITLIDSKLTHELVGETHTKKGKKYYRLSDYKVTIAPERVHYHFDDLFDGDRRLGDEINHVINENWEVVFGDVRSGYESSFGKIFKALANSLFGRVPYDDIFLK